MGILDFLKQTTNKFANEIERINKISKEKEKIDKDSDINIDFNFSTTLITSKKESFNKEQVIALFLKSMSYKPHKVGKNNEDGYPGYLTYDYNILDVPKFHKELIDKGYFCYASYESLIIKYKVKELKDLLIAKEQNVKGLKKDGLIELLLKITSDEDQEKAIKESGYYQLSQKGLDYLEEYKDFFTIYDFKKYGISYSQFMETKETLPQYVTLRDVVWHIFNDRLNYYMVQNEYSQIRGIYLNMAHFLEEEKPSVDVLYYYIMCLYFDINLIYTQKLITNNFLEKKEIINYINKDPLAPGILQKINQYSSYHDDKIFEKVFRNNTLPYEFIDNNTFKTMVHDIYNSSFFEKEKYIDIAIKNAEKIINKIA